MLDFFVRHREPWLTRVFKIITTVGSAGVLVPIGIVVGVVLWRARHTIKPLVFIAVTFVGAELGFRVIIGRNDFYSSGQIPLDLAASGQMERFGYIDPNDGGRVRLG